MPWVKPSERDSSENQGPGHTRTISGGTVDLHMLPPAAAINGARIRELTGDDSIPVRQRIILQAFRAVVGDRTCHIGFCLGNETGFSAIGIAVIDRLMMEAPSAVLHVVPIVHQDIAWDIVLRHLRSFTGRVLLFAFPDSDVYDAGTAEKYYSKAVRLFDVTAEQLERLTAGQRQKIREQKGAILNRPPPPPFYAASGVAQEDSPWIFRLATPAGKVIRTAVSDGRRNYALEFPEDIVRWVGGDKIVVVQVDSPVGVNRRSSLDLSAQARQGLRWRHSLGTRHGDLSIYPQVIHPARFGIDQSAGTSRR